MLQRFQQFLVTLALLFAASAAAAQAPDPAGLWALRSGGRNLMLLDLRRDPAGGWTGALQRPRGFAMTPNQVFPSGPAARRAIRSASPLPNGDLRLEVETTAGSAAFVLRPLAADVVAFWPEDAPGLRLPLVRVAADAALASDLAEGRSYPVGADWPSNPEMRALFEADQAARAEHVSIDGARLAREDEARAARARALLDSGALNSGDDFHRGAFIFQHGGRPDDYLLAHALAMAAVARGRADSTWIAAATLDRYLQSIGRAQVFGTQYSSPPGRPTTQGAYDRALVPDSLRHALGVPDAAGQEEQRRMFEAQARERERRNPPPPR